MRFLATCAGWALPALVTLPCAAATVEVAGNDSTAINQALRQAAAGDSVHLPARKYSITSPVSLANNVRLFGDGPDKTILLFAATQAINLVEAQDISGASVESLQIDGNRQPNASGGIVATHSHHLAFRHLLIQNFVKGGSFGPMGIYLTGNGSAQQGVTDSEIANCTLENIGVDSEWGSGIRLSDGSSRNKVVGNTIHNTGRGGIFASDGSTDVVVKGNKVSGSGGEGLGIEMWRDCQRAVVEDNQIDHWMSFDRSGFSAARRNLISDKSGTVKYAGIELVSAGNCIFTNNTIDSGQDIGLSLSGEQAKNWTYWGNNTISSCADWGAQFQGDQGGIAFQYLYKCTFSGTKAGKGKYPGDDGHGFRINGNSHDLTFEECQWTDNEKLGLQLGEGDRLCFLNCRISGNGQATEINPAYRALEWTGCRVDGNKQNALPAAKAFADPPSVASFDAPDRARAGQSITLTCTATQAAHVLWDLDDGPALAEGSVKHTYASPGTYHITLIVWDKAGRAGRATKTIHVEP